MNRLGYIGNSVPLNVQFLKNGVATDPFAIMAIKIYKTAVRDENLIQKIVFPCPGSSDYDAIFNSIIQRQVVGNTIGQCGTDLPVQYAPGAYTFNLCLSKELYTPGLYFDVWCFLGDANGGECTSGSSGSGELTAVSDSDPDENYPNDDGSCGDEDDWLCQCNKFYVRDGGWYIDDQLTTIRLGFEPIDSRFAQPEKRYLEVGMMPLPLYDFDYKKISALLPNLSATITITTQSCEVLVDNAAMTIGLRNGSYRSNPYELKYLIDTNNFLKGTYRYKVLVNLPDGTSISSSDYNFTIR